MRNVFVYAAAMTALGLSTSVYAADPTREELQAQLDELKAKVAQLEQVQQNVATKADVERTVKALLEDADRRSQLFAIEGFTAGWSDGRFILQSGDGNFLMHPYIWTQIRNTTTYREDGKQPNDSDDIQNGFEIRRLKFGIDGNAYTPKLTYKFQAQINRKDGSLVLDDAWVKYKICDSFSIRGGQFSDPFAHESLVSSRRFLTAERSYVNDYFSPNDNYVQGVSLIYDKPGPLRAEFAFTDGGNVVALAGNRNNSNQNFQDFETNNADWGVAGRAEFKVMGDWKNYDDFSALGTKDTLVVLGAGFDYTEVGDTGFLGHTLDLQFETNCGVSFYTAYYGRYTKDSPAGVNKPDPATGITTDTDHADLYDWGALAQAGYLINPKWEIFARYDFTDLDDDGVPAGVENKVHEITIGTNYFVYGHNCKFTLDGGWLPNGAPIADDGAGILVSADAEFYIRAQVQLAL